MKPTGNYVILYEIKMLHDAKSLMYMSYKHIINYKSYTQFSR